MHFALHSHAKGIDENNAKSIVVVMDAQLIRRAREHVGESQQVFGARFGVDQSTAHRWETIGPPSRGPARKAIERELAEIFSKPSVNPVEQYP